MKTSASILKAAAFFLLLSTAGCANSRQVTPPVPTTSPSSAEQTSIQTSPDTQDTVEAGPFDNGKMWTFEYPPIEYFEETYDFTPDSSWFERARLSALRLSGCSAAFVSPNGLVLTNHHCARSSIVKVSRPGENLLDHGFFASSLDEERPVEGFYADQLIHIRDVTDEITQAEESARMPSERVNYRDAAIERIKTQEKNRHSNGADSIVVEVISLYHGGRYSAYTFRRYTDLRLVAAPELQLGYFGGDSDNFTYPRYALDFALFRVYDDQGQPFKTNHYFHWSTTGIHEGEVVFVVGNPGSTSRLETVSQLEFRRDVQVPAMLDFLNSRISAIQKYITEHPEESDAQRNQVFSLLNALKAYNGRAAALNDDMIMARRRGSERDFQNAISSDQTLRTRYGNLIDQMSAIQSQKIQLANQYRGLFNLMNSQYSSAILQRSLLAHLYLHSREQNAGHELTTRLESMLLSVSDHPIQIEQAFLESQLEAIQTYLTPDISRSGLQLLNLNPTQLAGNLLEESVLRNASTVKEFIDSGRLSEDDPAIRLGSFLAPLYQNFQTTFADLEARSKEVASEIGRARFEVYGTDVPPDATFSLRITDGVVRGYEYNGTIAPTHTTFHGLYDHYYSYGAGTEWDLPERWLNPPAEFDRSTPVNFISTSDTIGGNSGSPVVDQNLEIVGINFDRNVEGLSRDYIYLPERGRNIMVDVRAIQEALDDIYNADHLVDELTTGNLVAE